MPKRTRDHSSKDLRHVLTCLLLSERRCEATVHVHNQTQYTQPAWQSQANLCFAMQVGLYATKSRPAMMKQCTAVKDTSSSSAYSSSASSYWSASSWFCVHMSALWFIEHCQTCHTRSLLFLTPLPLFLSPSRSLLSPELGWWRENPPPPCSLFSFGRARARGEPLSLSLSHWFAFVWVLYKKPGTVAAPQLLPLSLSLYLSPSLSLSRSLACLLACLLSLSLSTRTERAGGHLPSRARTRTCGSQVFKGSLRDLIPSGSAIQRPPWSNSPHC